MQEGLHPEFDVIIAGGGAAGIFCALQVAERRPEWKVVVFEKTSKLLAKVKVSGGGRCNVTHSAFNPFELARHYPRGQKQLKELFKEFDARRMIEWLELRGVGVHTEEDGRIFPATDDSQTIIDCFLKEAFAKKVRIQSGEGVVRIESAERGLTVTSSNGSRYSAQKVLVATGGNPNESAYAWISETGHSIRKPIPSLFTFNDSGKQFSDLMGVAVKDATVKIAGTAFEDRGPVLITHWGLSGPAVIRLSAWAAEYLHGVNYSFSVLVNWSGAEGEDDVRKVLMNMRAVNPRQKVYKNALFLLPQRLWCKLCMLAEIDEEKVWGELPNKNLNKLLENLFRCSFAIKGKTTFKEEFVTCGGVPLSEIDLETMESQRMKGLYFAGEVLDIDGETGGFNFQACWTTAYIAAKGMTQ